MIMNHGLLYWKWTSFLTIHTRQKNKIFYGHSFSFFVLRMIKYMYIVHKTCFFSFHSSLISKIINKKIHLIMNAVQWILKSSFPELLLGDLWKVRVLPSLNLFLAENWRYRERRTRRNDAIKHVFLRRLIRLHSVVAWIYRPAISFLSIWFNLNQSSIEKSATAI
jgi:hypothetical protein